MSGLHSLHDVRKRAVAPAPAPVAPRVEVVDAATAARAAPAAAPGGAGWHPLLSASSGPAPPAKTAPPRVAAPPPADPMAVFNPFIASPTTLAPSAASTGAAPSPFSPGGALGDGTGARPTPVRLPSVGGAGVGAGDASTPLADQPGAVAPRPPQLEEAVLDGEVPIFDRIDAYFCSPRNVLVPGNLLCTVYRLQFEPVAADRLVGLRHLPAAFFSVPVAAIKRVDKLPRSRDTPSALLEVRTKDLRTLRFGFRDDLTCDKMCQRVAAMAFPGRPDFLPAFSCSTPNPTAVPPTLPEHSPVSGPPTSSLSSGAAASSPSSSPATPASSGAAPAPRRFGWDLFNPYRELARMGILDARSPHSADRSWRVTEANREYAYAPTYPSVLVVPETFPDRDLEPVRTFRSRGRIPAITWRHPACGTTLWRSSQPKVGVSNNACTEDERLLQFIRVSAGAAAAEPDKHPLIVADCRPRANAIVRAQRRRKRE